MAGYLNDEFRLSGGLAPEGKETSLATPNLANPLPGTPEADRRERELANVRTASFGTSTRKPEEQAEAQSLGRALGVDPRVVLDDLEGFRSRFMQEHIANTARDNPAVRTSMQDPALAGVARDKVDELAAVERAFKVKKHDEAIERAANKGFFTGAFDAIVNTPANMALGVNAVKAGFQEETARDTVIETDIARKEGEITSSRPARLTLTRGGQSLLPSEKKETREALAIEAQAKENLVAAHAERQQVERDRRMITPQHMGVAGEAITSLGQSSVPTIAAIGVGIATKNPWLAMGIGGLGGGFSARADTYGEAYDAYVKQGKDPEEAHRLAQRAGTIDQVIESAGEALGLRAPLARLFKPDTSLARILFTSMVAEAGSEGAVSLTQDLHHYLTYNPEMTLEQAMHNLQVATLAGFMGGGVYGLQGSLAEQKVAEIKSIQDAFGNVEKSVTANARLQDVLAKAEASEVRGRDSVQFAAFMQNAAAGTDLTHVHVDGVLLQEAVAKGTLKPEQLSPDVRAALNEAVELGGSVAIPIHEYAATVLGTEAHGALQQHLKADVNGMSTKETEAFLEVNKEKFSAIGQRIISAQQDSAVFRAGSEMIKANILGQLEAGKRFSRNVHESYASLVGAFFDTQAARTGKDHGYLWEKFKLHISAQTGATIGEKLDQQQASIAEMIRRAEANKSAVDKLISDGRITNEHSFRGMSEWEWRRLASTGQMVDGKNAEGLDSIAASPLTEGGKSATGYGNTGFAVIFPPHAVERGESGIENWISPKYDAREAIFLVDGQVLSAKDAAAFRNDDMDFTKPEGGFAQSPVAALNRAVILEKRAKHLEGTHVVGDDGTPLAVYSYAVPNDIAPGRGQINDRWGRVLYFSSDRMDTTLPHSAEVEQRITEIAVRERAMNEELTVEQAVQRATAMFVGEVGHTISSYVAIRKPATVGGPTPTRLMEDEMRHLVKRLGTDAEVTTAALDTLEAAVRDKGWITIQHARDILDANSSPTTARHGQLLAGGLRDLGYDGIIEYRKFTGEPGGPDELVHYMAFATEAPVSATDPAGAFVPESNSIRKQTMWYSELQKQVGNLQRGSGTATEWAAAIAPLKTKGVKQDEIDLSGVLDWLKFMESTAVDEQGKPRKITKLQVMDYLSDEGQTLIVREQHMGNIANMERGRAPERPAPPAPPAIPRRDPRLDLPEGEGSTLDVDPISLADRRRELEEDFDQQDEWSPDVSVSEDSRAVDSEGLDDDYISERAEEQVKDFEESDDDNPANWGTDELKSRFAAAQGRPAQEQAPLFEGEEITDDALESFRDEQQEEYDEGHDKRIEKAGDEIRSDMEEDTSGDSAPVLVEFSTSGDDNPSMSWTLNYYGGEWSLTGDGISRRNPRTGSAGNIERAIEQAEQYMSELAYDSAREADSENGYSDRRDRWVNEQLKDEGFDFDLDEDEVQGELTDERRKELEEEHVEDMARYERLVAEHKQHLEQHAERIRAYEAALEAFSRGNLPPGIHTAASQKGRPEYTTYVLPGQRAPGTGHATIALSVEPKQPTGWGATKIEGTEDKFGIVNERTGEFLRAITKDEKSGKKVLGDPIQYSQEQATRISERMSQQQRTYSNAHGLGAEFDANNVIAHARVTVRQDADGKNVLMIEEFQSDWANLARERTKANPLHPPMWYDPTMTELPRGPKGEALYTTTQERGGWRVKDAQGGTLTSGHSTKEAAEKAAIAAYLEKTAPTGPFVQKTEAWIALMAKRIIRYAVENGIDRIAWTTGGQQAERYPHLRTVAEAIRLVENEAQPGTVQLEAYDANGSKISTQQPLIAEDSVAGVARFTGLDIAKQLFAAREEQSKVRSSFAEGSAVQSMTRAQLTELADSESRTLDTKLRGRPAETDEEKNQEDKNATQAANMMASEMLTLGDAAFTAKLPRDEGYVLQTHDNGVELPRLFRTEEEAQRHLDAWVAGQLEQLDIGHAEVKGEAMELGRSVGASKVYDEIMANTVNSVLKQLGFPAGTKVGKLKVKLGTGGEGVSMGEAQQVLGERFNEATAGATDPRPVQPPPLTNEQLNAARQRLPEVIHGDSAEGLLKIARGIQDAVAIHAGTFVGAQDRGTGRTAEFYADLKGKPFMEIISAMFGGGLLTQRAAGRIESAASNFDEAGEVLAGMAEIAVHGAAMDAYERELVAWDNRREEAKNAARGAFLGRAKAAATEGIEQQGIVIPPEMMEKLTEPMPLMQPARGEIAFGGANARIGDAPTTIALLKDADLSTFLHELGHFFLEVYADVADTPDGPQNIKDDFDRIMAWFKIEPQDGMTPRERWRSFSLEQKRAYHEKFARGFETYLMEGKSPSLELTGIFGKFRAWLTHVYKALTSPSLDADLSDEVRGVMDRMLATDEMIAETHRMRGMMPLFLNATEAGYDDEEWAAYQQLDAEARNKAINDLDRAGMRDMAWTRNAKSKALRSIHKGVLEKRAAMKDEVTEELQAEQVYRARWFLQTGEVSEGTKLDGPHKLDMAALREMYGDGPAAPWRYLPTGKSGLVQAEGGMHPDHAAELMGYASGDAMVRDILSKPKLAEAVEIETDTRMLERYGDISSPKAMARAAEHAVHNDVRARMVATELRAVGKINGAASLLNKAAKVAAEAMIAAKRIMDIKPVDFLRMESKAAKLAEASFRAGKTQDTAAAKRNQLLAMHGAKQAALAREEVERKRVAMTKLLKNKNLPPEYRDQIAALLERYSLAPTTVRERSKRVTLAQFVAEQAAVGLEPNIDKQLLAEMDQVPFEHLTLEEFRGLHDAVQQIAHLGRLKDKLLDAREKRELQQLLADLKAGIEANAPGPGKNPPRSGETHYGKGAIDIVKGVIAEHRTFHSMLRELDGFKDGGPMWTLLGRRANDAGDYETDQRSVYAVRLAKILEPVLKLTKIRGVGAERISVKEVGESFTREQLIGVGLNMGNSVNIERVMNGEKWTRPQLEAVLRNLRAEDVAAIEKVWEMLDSFRPEMEAKHLRVFGTRPEWVAAEPFTFPGTGLKVKGGYYPISYDAQRGLLTKGSDAEQLADQIRKGELVRSTTRRGHLEARAESTGKPLRYDFMGIVAGHVNQVIHDLAWHEYLVDANRVLRSEQVAQTIRRHYSPDFHKELTKVLTDIAVGNARPNGHLERAASFMRAGAGVSIMAFSITNMMQQPLGIAQSMTKVGAFNFMRAYAKWATGTTQGEMEATLESIRSKSKFMRHRSATQTREIEELINQVDTSRAETAMRDLFFYPIQMMQTMVDIPTWIAAYDMHFGKPEEDRIALADQAVKDTQGSGLIHDRAGALRGNEFKQLFTLFGSYFSTTYNLNVEAAKKISLSNPVKTAKAITTLMMLNTVPATLGFALMAALKGDFDDWDDPEKLAKKLAAENVSYLMNTMFLVRELSGVVKGAITGKKQDYQGPAGTTLISAGARLVQQTAQFEFDRAWLKSAVSTAGVLFKLPATQVNRLIDYTWAKMNGRQVAPQSVLGGPPADQLK